MKIQLINKADKLVSLMDIHGIDMCDFPKSLPTGIEKEGHNLVGLLFGGGAAYRVFITDGDLTTLINNFKNDTFTTLKINTDNLLVTELS